MCTQIDGVWQEAKYWPDLTHWNLATMCLNFDAKSRSYSTAEKAVNVGEHLKPSLVVLVALVGASLLFGAL